MPQGRQILSLFAVAAELLLVSGCALGPLGPLASFDGSDDLANRGRNCAGLAIERTEHAQRISILEAAVKTELAGPPDTLVHAIKRLGNAPEAGTKSYAELTAERAKLAESEAAAGSAKCATVVGEKRS